MKAGAALYSAELRHVMSQSDRWCAFFLRLSPKSYSMRSSPTADSCVSCVYRSNLVGDILPRQAGFEQSLDGVFRVIGLEASAIPLGECQQRCVGRLPGPDAANLEHPLRRGQSKASLLTD